MAAPSLAPLIGPAASGTATVASGAAAVVSGAAGAVVERPRSAPTRRTRQVPARHTSTRRGQNAGPSRPPGTPWSSPPVARRSRQEAIAPSAGATICRESVIGSLRGVGYFLSPNSLTN